MTNPFDPYTAQESEGLALGAGYFGMFDSFAAKKVPMDSPLTKAKTLKLPGTNIHWGYSKTTVRAAPPAVVASLCDETSNEYKNKYDAEKVVLDAPNEHTHVMYLSTQGSTLSTDCATDCATDFVYSSTWKKIDDRRYVVVKSVADRSDRPDLPDVVRGISQVCYKIKRLSDTETKVERVFRIDPGGHIHYFVANFFVKGLLRTVDRIRDDFQATRSLEMWKGEEDRGEGDGIAVGYLLTTPTDAEKIKTNQNKHASLAERRTDFLFANNQGLADVHAKYAFFKPMVRAMLLNEWSMPTDVDASLETLSSDAGGKLGGAFTYFLLTSPTALSATDKWIVKFPALTELAVLEPWFRPMVVTMTRNIMDEIPFALKLKLFIGAVLSIVDTATDVRMVFAYWALGEYFYAYSMIAMISACMVFQLLMVYGQNAGAPRGVMLREILYVLVAIKPGVDAMRCAKMQEDNKATDALAELAISKSIEMVCESIPGSVLQTLAMLRIFLRGGGVSKTAVTSLLVSAFTTSFSSTIISFNYDVDTDRRARNPDFYGYISNEPVAQAKIFFTMMLNSTLLIMVKSFSAALIIVVGSEYYSWYLALDMALYFVQKLLRNDFWYWPPVHGAMGAICLVFGRSMPKIVVDFTALAQYRGPGELGGIYWSINLVLAVLVAFASVPFYFTFANTDDDVKALDERSTYIIMSGICAAFILNFAYFVYQMEPKYRRTFFSFETGCQWVHKYFFKGTTDEVRVKVAACNYHMWKSIRSEVVEFFHENWEKWEAEKPEWFTRAFKKKLYRFLLPPDVLRAMDAKYGDGRRRSSFAEIMGFVGGEEGGNKVAPGDDSGTSDGKM
jgi:hypothetical protein